MKPLFTLPRFQLGLLIAFSSIALSTANAGIDVSGIDKNAAPGDSFNQYANGAWLQRIEIPSDKPYYGTFTIIGDQTRTNLMALLAEIREQKKPTTLERRVRNYHRAFMDEKSIESKAITPLQPLLESIAAIHNKLDLARAIGESLRADVDPLNNTDFETENLFGVWISQGLQDPNHYYPYLLQGGLGMPDRDYYVSGSTNMENVRVDYRKHIAAMLKLAGVDNAAERADRIFALEMKIAEAHASRTECADAHFVKQWSRQELASNAPGLDWGALLKAAQLNDARTFYVWQPKAISALSKLTETESLETWKDWLTFHTVDRSANFLSDPFVQQWFAFHGKSVTGTPEMQPRWQRGIDVTSGTLSDSVGQLYVAKYFGSDSKKKIESMVRDLKAAFEERIEHLTWMNPQTKATAKKKLRTLRVAVGYPKDWKNENDFEVRADDAFGNARRAELANYRRHLKKLKQRVSRDEWWMAAQEVNAINMPLQNAIAFPAAILQPPIFDPSANIAQNYGAIGMIIGHEISHSFDDQGSLFDERGRFTNWWTADDLSHFKAASEALAQQFDQYRPFPDLAVNGHQTLSENIADLAGLAAAYDAYRRASAREPVPIVGGFSGDQQFFISYAQFSRAKMRDETLRMIVASDGHAPAAYRTETVRNIDGWYDAFPISPKQKLYLRADQRVHVW